ncbi:hypothetical protein SBBP2_1590013 [Burkholderiales bacterium]|nr:hypothetical protein SBBP2_1590013 [Burkholderiales bacterium]
MGRTNGIAVREEDAQGDCLLRRPRTDMELGAATLDLVCLQPISGFAGGVFGAEGHCRKSGPRG